MNILVDTSVWSESLRRKKNDIDSHQTFLSKLIKNDEIIIITGIIIQEILSGITNNNLFDEIKNILSGFAYLEPKKDDYIYASYLRNILKSNGITTGTVDILLASLAIRNNLYLVTYDNDFINMTEYCSLKILSLEQYLIIKKNNK